MGVSLVGETGSRTITSGSDNGIAAPIVRSSGVPLDYIRSKIAAMPWPPPMHMVTSA